jgi:hypothetical protein
LSKGVLDGILGSRKVSQTMSVQMNPPDNALIQALADKSARSSFESPRPRLTNGTAHNLPSQLSSFIGREWETTEVKPRLLQ